MLTTTPVEGGLDNKLVWQKGARPVVGEQAELVVGRQGFSDEQCLICHQ